jgi:hypothetical protein
MLTQTVQTKNELTLIVEAAQRNAVESGLGVQGAGHVADAKNAQRN